MGRIFKNSFITLITQIIFMGLTIATAIILARTLGPELMGKYALLILIVTLITQFISLGIGSANVYFIGSGKYKISSFISNSIIFTIIISSLSFLVIYYAINTQVIKKILIKYYLNSSDLYMVFSTIPFSLITLFLRNILLGKEKIITFNKLNLIKGTLAILTVIFFVLILNLNFYGAICAYVVSVIFYSIVIIYLIYKNYGIHINFNMSLFKDSFFYGIKAHLANIMQFLNYRIDMLFITFFLNFGALGYYAISVKIAEQILLIPNSVAVVLFPRISNAEDSYSNKATPLVVKHTFYFMLLISMVMIILANPIIKILFGKEYIPSINPLLILLPGIIALSVTKIIGADFSGRGKLNFNLLAVTISLVVNICLNTILIPTIGIIGAALATTITYLLTSLLCIILLNKISNTSVKEIFGINRNDFILYKDNFFKHE